MKPPWLCLFLILTSLEINSAAGNTYKEGVHVEEDAQGSYSIKIKISRNVNHREVVVNINLNAIELENLSVNLKFDDTLNSKSSENTTPPHEGDRNEPMDNDRSKPDGDPSIVGLNRDETNDNQTDTEDIAWNLKENKTNQHGDEQNETYISNWFWKIWNIAYEGLINVFGCNELPKNINLNCLHWRTVTALRAIGHSSPGYDCEDPIKYITSGNKSSISAWSLQPIIQGDITHVKTEEDKEVYHVPSILRMPMDEVIPQNLTDKQNGYISVKSQHYQTTDNVSMGEATLFNKTIQHGDKQNKPKDNGRSKPGGDPSISGLKKDKTNDNQTVSKDIALKDNYTMQHGDIQNETYMSTWFWEIWHITYEGLINVFPFPGYDCEDPTKHITNGNKSSASAWSTQPVIQGDIFTVKTDENKEMYHVPFILRMAKNYEQYRLPGYNSSERMDEAIPRSLTDKQPGSNITVESQQYQTTDNVSVEREATLFNKTMQHGDKQNKPKERNKRKPDGDPSIVGLKEDETNDIQTVTEDIALLPGHNFTVDMNEIILRNLTDKQNVDISVESQRYQTTDNVSMKRAATLTDKNVSTVAINDASWLAKKSRNITRMENDGRILVEKVSDVNYLARFYGNTTRITTTNSIWQEIFEIIVMYWMFDIGVMNLNCTACFIKGIIWLLRMLLERKLNKEQERLRKLEQKGTGYGRRKLM